MTPEAERFNGWAAMLGFVAAVGAYVTTGQIIPGWFQAFIHQVFENDWIQNVKSFEPISLILKLKKINLSTKFRLI